MNKPIQTITAVAILFTVSLSSKTQVQAQTEQPGVKVMTFNVLHGGTRLGQPLAQTAKVIQEAKADIVGLQEVGNNVVKLAQLLGWNYVSHGSSAIVTRYQIIEHHPSGIKVQLSSDQQAYIFNLHLKPAPYQPYQLLRIPYGNARFIKTEAEAIASAKEARGGQIEAALESIRALPDKKAVVFVTGDFNEPSHLDWTDAAARSGRHPIKVMFPGSLEMAKAGFADAWRTIYPDEIKKPGFTWTPLTKVNDPKDHHDRIDFVYFRGKAIKLNDVKIVGENQVRADIVIDPYPSDHRAVVATFTFSNDAKIKHQGANKSK
ncbi:MAG: endonuclease/exonuclease/phosphatase family protein [Verrucomicrobiae bacterium]|nr:endonuclease/exonuclease/phosphatase family protein [Verrucomicrobiae bacterium]NNJ86875.1 hypothetical protein [Akkermansiaceae bacterium]